MPTRPRSEDPKVYISGVGAHLPDHTVTNETLAKLTGIDPEWIRSRTGITRRYLSRSGDRTSNLAARAAREALAQAGVEPGEVELLLVASSFPDAFPPASTATAVKHKLGLVHAHVVDINTPLTGFLYALRFARDTLAAGTMKVALVVGAESFSSASDLNDRRTCYMFSDGAGALVLTKKKGFAVLGPVTVGNGATPEELEWCESEAEREPFTLHGKEVPGLREALNRALGELVGKKSPATPVHVVSQQLAGVASSAFSAGGPSPAGNAAPPALRQLQQRLAGGVSDAAGQSRRKGGVDGGPPPARPALRARTEQGRVEGEVRPGVQVFDGFADCAYLMSASLPVSLYHLLRWGEAKARDRAMMFTTDGRGAWCGNMVEILSLPAWNGVAASAPANELPKPAGEGRDQRDFFTCSRDDARAMLESEAKRADPARGSLVCLGFKLQVGGAPSRELRTQVERELRTILTGNTRGSDALIRLEGSPLYAILLREVELADAQRLCHRLVGLLEDVDLAGEISVKVDSKVCAHAAGKAPAAFAKDVLAGLPAAAR